MAEPYQTFLKGGIIRSNWQVKFAGEFISPSVVTCKTQLDGASSTSQVVAQDGVGRYHADIDTSSMTAGDYTVSWQGIGTAVAKREARFTIQGALIP